MVLIGPCRHGKQSRAALLDRGQHPVPAQGVEGILPVDSHSDAAGVGGNACSEGVASYLAASLDANADLKGGQVSPCIRAGCEGTQRSKPVPDLADGKRADAPGRLGDGKEAEVEEAGEVR
jgi:hypothetical protein